MFGGLKPYLVTGSRDQQEGYKSSEVITAHNEFEAQKLAKEQGFVHFELKPLEEDAEPSWRN